MYYLEQKAIVILGFKVVYLFLHFSFPYKQQQIPTYETTILFGTVVLAAEMRPFWQFFSLGKVMIAERIDEHICGFCLYFGLENWVHHHFCWTLLLMLWVVFVTKMHNGKFIMLCISYIYFQICHEPFYNASQKQESSSLHGNPSKYLKPYSPLSRKSF